MAGRLRPAAAVAAVATAALMVAAAAPAHADDLEDYLEMAASGDYAGRRVVVTIWDGVPHSGVFHVEHAGDMTMVEGRDAATIIGGGKVAVADSGGVALSAWNPPHLAERYRTGEPKPVTLLGREAVEVVVYEQDRPRAVIVFDTDTWAPLATEIYDDDGEMFRFAAFTELDVRPNKVYAAMRDERSYDVVTQMGSSNLPATAGGYSRVDAYVDADGVTQAYFSDGLFSFSVFALAGADMSEGFEDTVVMEVDGQPYDVLVNATEVWVRWRTGGGTLLLVGDLPPDHLADVLRSLPAPQAQGLLDRLWSGLFG